MLLFVRSFARSFVHSFDIPLSFSFVLLRFICSWKDFPASRGISFIPVSVSITTKVCERVHANGFTGAAQKQAVEETKAVFGPLRERIAAAVEKLEGLLVSFLFSLCVFLSLAPPFR